MPSATPESNASAEVSDGIGTAAICSLAQKNLSGAVSLSSTMPKVQRLDAETAVGRVAQFQQPQQMIAQHPVVGRPEQDTVMHQGGPLSQDCLDHCQVVRIPRP